MAILGKTLCILLARSAESVIAHRLSTIKLCDRIIVLNGGVIAEDGTYEELLAKGGLFAELVEKQMLDRNSENS